MGKAKAFFGAIIVGIAAYFIFIHYLGPVYALPWILSQVDGKIPWWLGFTEATIDSYVTSFVDGLSYVFAFAIFILSYLVLPKGDQK